VRPLLSSLLQLTEAPSEKVTSMLTNSKALHKPNAKAIAKNKAAFVIDGILKYDSIFLHID
jgi:hypothetical protein